MGPVFTLNLCLWVPGLLAEWAAGLLIRKFGYIQNWELTNLQCVLLSWDTVQAFINEPYNHAFEFGRAIEPRAILCNR
jgi:hypothetical protein